jgi:Uncharacterised protein family (UPF0193)
LNRRGRVCLNLAYFLLSAYKLALLFADGAYDNDKRRLANMMAYGKDMEPPANKTRPVRVARQEEEHEDTDRFTECNSFTLIPYLYEFKVWSGCDMSEGLGWNPPVIFFSPPVVYTGSPWGSTKPPPTIVMKLGYIVFAEQWLLYVF